MRRLGRLRRGFTLMELLVSLAIVAIVMGTAIPMVSSITSVNEKQAAQSFAGHLKYLFDRAILERVYIRVVIDFEQNAYWAEFTKDPLFLTQKPMSVEEGAVVVDSDSSEDDSQELVDNKVLFNDPANYKWTGWADFAGKFRKKKAAFTAFTTDLSTKTNLPKDVKFYSVMTQSLEKPVTTGQIWIHIFPNGYIEKAAVAIVRAEDLENPDLRPADMDMFSISTDPLTGRASIDAGLVELKEDPDDEQPF